MSHIIHLVSNKVWGGGERYVLDLATAQKASDTVDVFTRHIPAVSEPFEKAGLLRGYLRFGGVWDVFTPVRLASYINKIDKDVRIIIHVHNFKDAYTAIAARKLCRDAARVRIVCTRHLIRQAKTDSSHTRIYDGLDAVIFVSETARKEFLSSQPDVNPSKLQVVLNSIVAPQAVKRDAASFAERPVRLIYVGRIIREKGLDLLIKALDELPRDSWTLEVCGTGKGRDVMPVVRAARDLGIDKNITWSGHVSDVAARMAAADIAVVPSRFREPFGLVILEAFAAALPVITTNHGAQAEIITDGADGILVNPEDPHAIAEAIRSLIEDPSKRHTMSDNAVDTFNTRWGYDRFVSQINDVYKNLF